jgi:Fe2+ transport system protein FeoA
MVWEIMRMIRILIGGLIKLLYMSNCKILANVKSNTKVVVQELCDCDERLACKLASAGVCPKSALFVLHNFGSRGLIVKVNGANFALDAKTASKIYVEPR